LFAKDNRQATRMTKNLSDIYLFGGLSAEQLARVADTSQSLQLENGQILFTQGDPARRFFLVDSGQIKLFRMSPEGDEKVIELVSPGGTFAEALIFADDMGYPVNASAIGKSELTAFDNPTFRAILAESTETCFRVMADLTLRLRALIREIDELTLQSAACRVAGYLLRSAAAQQDGGSQIVLHTPKAVVASRLSVTPETFSRILHQLRDEHVIRVFGNQIEIRDLEKLQERVEGISYTREARAQGKGLK
jgi:CRP-like cAMP-binding protein